MKFLHTSDLHIGKKLDGILRLDEQKAVLNEILAISLQEKVDVVLIAGDVYDTFIPSSDAENLFFEMVDLFSQNGIIVVCISGNHDDEDRLIASKLLASRRGIYLCGENNDFEKKEFKVKEQGRVAVEYFDTIRSYNTFGGMVYCYKYHFILSWK
jgi:exonuclease SbcD